MPTIIDLSALGPAGFIIQGDAAGDQAGRSVSSAGDVNGDGYDDLIVGAPFGDDGGTDAGEAYVIFGKAGGFGAIDLSSLGADGFIIQGDAAGDQAGFSVSSAGDVNGDGFDDLIVGARYGDDGGSYAGEAYVIFGRASGFGTIDLTGLAPADGFVIQGDAAGDVAGWSVSSAGDVNGDGFDDLIVGAPLGDDGGANAGEAYVVFGKAGGFGTIDLTALAPADGFLIQGDTAGDQAGVSVSSAGDVNGDGYDDLIVGARFGDDGGDGAGEAYVIFGKASGFGTIDLTGLAPADGFVILGDFDDDRAGSSVSSAGDVNGDGYDDLIVGAPFGDDGGDGAGEAYVIFGKASGFGTIDLTALAPADGFIIEGAAAYDTAGASVSSAGDFNGDGFDDIVIGATYGGDGGVPAGEAYVIFGKASGFGTIDLADLAPADGLVIRGDFSDDRAGSSVSSAGDVNGDGFDDLIVGAPYGDDGGTSAGEAYVIFGFGPGDFPAVFDLGEDLTPASGFFIQGDVAGDLAGATVSWAGDVNGDGFDDVIVGANYGDDGGADAGEVYVIFGKASGFGTIDLTGLAPADGFVIQGDAAGDQAGFSVSSAGDVNGDGFDDLIVGARYGDDGGGSAGEAYVIFGKAGGFGTIDLTGLAPADGFIIRGDAAADRAGWSVSSAGDVNGDGYDDVIVGAPAGSDGGNAAGEAYVIFGKASGFGAPDPADPAGRNVIDLTDLAPADGFVVQGDVQFDRAGWSVSSAGDVNGDGYDDVIVGAPGIPGAVGGVDDGSEAYVLFGKASGFGVPIGGRDVIDLTGLAPADGFVIRRDFSGSLADFSVSSAGDVNGDGFDDMLVGTRFGSGGGMYSGETHVVFGKASGFGTIDLDGLAPADGFLVQGGAEQDGSGISVSAAGDVNGDGFDDLIVGAPGRDDGGYNAGGAYVIFGRAPTTAVTRIGSAADQTIRGGAFNDTLIGGAGNDTLIGGAGADLLEGGPGNDTYTVEDALDTIVEQPGGGIDTVNSSIASYTLGANLENLVLLTGAGNGIGNGLDNILTGNAAGNDLVGRGGNDTLLGLGGSDVLRGQDGNDTLWGDLGHDDLFGGNGNDTLQGHGSNDRLYGNAGDDFVNGGLGDDNVFGGSGNDTVHGGNGADILNGHAGNDLIVGGPGNDLLVGGLGADRFLFNPGHLGGGLSATDRIKDFSQAQNDVIDLHNLDADSTTGGNQAFTWIGGAAFSGAAGELRYAIAGNTTTITGDTNGDGTADFALWLTGQIALVAGDFVL